MADKQITGLDDAGALTNAALMVLREDGDSEDNKVTLAALINYIQATLLTNVNGNGRRIQGWTNGVVAYTSAHTFTSADSGNIIEVNVTASTTCLLPNNMPVGWTATVVQASSGAAVLVATTGASIVNRYNQFSTSGKEAMCVVYVTENSSGTEAKYRLGGDTA